MMSTLVTAHFSDALLSLRVRGFDETGQCLAYKPLGLTAGLMKCLQQRCPNLNDLRISDHSLGKGFNTMRVTDLPKTLARLDLPSCYISKSCISDIHEAVPGLTSLNLYDVLPANQTQLLVIRKCTKLRVLNLNLCSRVTPQTIAEIACNLLELRELYLKNTFCDDECLQLIAHNLKHLEKLSLGEIRFSRYSKLRNARFTTVGLIHGLRGMTTLMYLDVSFASGFDDNVLDTIKHLPNLVHVVVSDNELVSQAGLINSVWVMSSLKYLDMSNSCCDNTVLDAIKHLPKLVHLNVSHTSVTAAGVALMEGTCRVICDGIKQDTESKIES